MGSRKASIGSSLGIVRMILKMDGEVLNSEIRRTAREEMFLCNHPSQTDLHFLETDDPCRFAAMELAIRRIRSESIPGCFAELGVWRGDSCAFIHALDPSRPFYLFDTFEGFHEADLAGKKDERFKDTSINTILSRIGNTDNIHIRKGYFPDTAIGLEGLRFAFVHFDFDLFGPTLAALEFFYERMSKGGYLFLHDFNNKDPSFDFGVQKAVDSFFKDKPEQVVELPDKWGSVIVRKID